MTVFYIHLTTIFVLSSGRVFSGKLSIVSKWTAVNKLTIDADKAHYMIFYRNKSFPSTVNPMLEDNRPPARINGLQ